RGRRLPRTSSLVLYPCAPCNPWFLLLPVTTRTGCTSARRAARWTGMRPAGRPTRSAGGPAGPADAAPSSRARPGPPGRHSPTPRAAPGLGPPCQTCSCGGVVVALLPRPRRGDGPPEGDFILEGRRGNVKRGKMRVILCPPLVPAIIQP